MHDMQVSKLFREKRKLTGSEVQENERLGLWREHVQNGVKYLY